MDLNQGLTQTLSDGTTDYVYGAGRVAQINGGVEYFLGDALGSVRQLVDGAGAVSLAQSFDPYGQTQSQAGDGASSYAFTGEYSANGLVYLRARHYAPSMGRFLSRDTWAGDANRPQSLNRWAYVEGNPVRFTDPSGHGYCDSAYHDPSEVPNGCKSSSNIPAPRYYQCIPSSGQVCINQYTDAPLAIAHTIYQEGGSLSNQIAANVTQTIHNRAYIAWTCHSNPNCRNNPRWKAINPFDIPWEDITEDQFSRLIVFLLSEPYEGDNGVNYPAYNGWGVPRDEATINRLYPEKWIDHMTGILNWLNLGCGELSRSAPIIFGNSEPAIRVRDVNVMYFYSTYEELSADFVYYDPVKLGEKTLYTYYFTHPYP